MDKPMKPKTKVCTCCGKRKSTSQFYKRSYKSTDTESICKKCRLVKNAKYRDDKRKEGSVQFTAAKIYQNMCTRHKKVGITYLPEFTVEDIMHILTSTKCEVSNRSYNCKNITKYHVNPFVASPDRIDNNIGYKKDNVRWVMAWVNLARQSYDVDFFVKLVKGVKW